MRFKSFYRYYKIKLIKIFVCCLINRRTSVMLKVKDPATIKSLASTEWLCTKDMVSWTSTSLFCNLTDKSSLVTRLNRFVCPSMGAELVPDRSVTSQVSVDVGPFMERRFSVVLKHGTDVCTVRGGQSRLARQVFACGNKGFPVPCQSFFLLTRRSCTICLFVCFITAKTQAFILFLYFFIYFLCSEFLMSVHKNRVECFYLQRWTTSVTIAILLNLFLSSEFLMSIQKNKVECFYL